MDFPLVRDSLFTLGKPTQLTITRTRRIHKPTETTELKIKPYEIRKDIR